MSGSKNIWEVLPFHESDDFNWQLRAYWVFKSMDSLANGKDEGEQAVEDDDDEGGEEVVLPEAEGVSEWRRARVRLPSGKILRVAGSVLMEYCHALKPYNAELLNGVVWLTYKPLAEWKDWVVIEFFSYLHKDWMTNGYIKKAGVYHEFGPLSFALDVPETKQSFEIIAAQVLRRTGKNAKPPRSFYRWLGAYQLFSPSWARQGLGGLLGMPPDRFTPFLDPAHRPKLFEAFSRTEILNLAVERWTQRQLFEIFRWPLCLHYGYFDKELDGAKLLPPFMQLRLVISPKHSIICNYDLMETRSVFIRNAPVDETNSIPTMHIPFASSFPPSEVLAFFQLLDQRSELTPDSSWKMSWVQLADYLQAPIVLNAAAPWIWDKVHFDCFIDWVAATRVQSMQQRRPSEKANTVEHADLIAILTAPDVQGCRDLAPIVERYGQRFVDFLGMDSFLDVLRAKPTSA